jgi:hypothetical protein
MAVLLMVNLLGRVLMRDGKKRHLIGLVATTFAIPAKSYFLIIPLDISITKSSI